MKNLQVGMTVENRIPNSSIVIVCRVVEKLDSVSKGMWRLVDLSDDNGKSDKKLIEQSLTWGCPEENIFHHDAECIVCHKDGLVSFIA
jgi:hypothetical protein